MSISLIGSPASFAPGYNNVTYYFDSTNKALTGFRYIVDVYQKTGPSSQTLIKRMRIAPEFSTGYCVAEISKTLQAFLTNQLPTNNSSIDASNSYLRYNLEIGEEYQVEWEYDDYEFYSAPTGASDPFNAYTLLTSDPVGGGGSMNTHTFVVGDQINVDQTDGGVEKPMLQGLQTIVAVPDNMSVVINVPFSTTGSGPTIGGSVTYFDNRKTIFANLLTISDKTVFNGAIPHFDFTDYTATTFALSTSNLGTALTNCPTQFNVRLNTRLSFNWFNNYATTATYIYFENDLGTIRRATINSSTVPVLAIGVGPENMLGTTLISGTGQIIQDGITYYRFWIANGSAQRTSQYYYMYLDNDCTKYDEYSIEFLDRLGSIGSFSFIYDSIIAGTIERSSQKYLLGGLSGGKWTYLATDTGQRSLNVNVDKTFTLTTAWLTEAESIYFQELLSSPVAFIQIDGTSWACTVQESSYTIKKLNTTKNLRYTVNVKLANNDNINW